MDPESQFQQRFISSNNSNINAPEVVPDTQVDQKCVPRAPLLPKEPQCCEVAAHQKEVHQSGAAPLRAPICA